MRVLTVVKFKKQKGTLPTYLTVCSHTMETEEAHFNIRLKVRHFTARSDLR